jgi:ABC-type branched-subunit amino acid transport system ATPase component
MAALLEVEDLVRSFGGLRAVDHASFDVESGSITGLIGPNGAGKSTVFNCTTGVLRPEAGRIVFEGRRIDRSSTHRIARSGLVRTFQTARTLTRMTVRENVLLAAKNQRGERLTGWLFWPRAARRQEWELRQRADELLALVRLESHADAYAGTLSGGQRKLLDLARVLMLEPRLVLLDEPLAGVSPSLRRDLLQHIVAVRSARSVTFLIVEHDLDFVMQATDDVIVMSEGRVISRGSPNDIRSDERVVDAYLGARHETTPA